MEHVFCIGAPTELLRGLGVFLVLSSWHRHYHCLRLRSRRAFRLRYATRGHHNGHHLRCHGNLFASLSALREDQTADASIVNVTGSNSVNVFLGLGLPWTVASLYWSFKTRDSSWKLRYSDVDKAIE